MVWARHSLTDIREKLGCRSLKAIVHQAYEHSSRGGSTVVHLFRYQHSVCYPFGKGILEYGIQSQTQVRRITG